jgi:hypothetical protein
MVTGVGTIVGESAGISGRLTAPEKIEGLITFLDESQVAFEVERSPDGTVLLRGFGAPIELRKE